MKRLLILVCVLGCLAFAGQQFPSRYGAHFYKVASCTASTWTPVPDSECPSIAYVVKIADSICAYAALDSLGLWAGPGISVWRGADTTYVAADTVWFTSWWTRQRVADSTWQKAQHPTDTLSPHFDTKADSEHNLYTDTLYYKVLSPVVTATGGTDTLAFHFGKGDTLHSGAVDTLWGSNSGVIIGTFLGDTTWTVRVRHDSIFGSYVVAGFSAIPRILTFATGVKATILKYDTAYATALAALDTSKEALRKAERDSLLAVAAMDTAKAALRKAERDSLLALAGAVPVGGVTLWSGTIATIPKNWWLCNGDSGTSNLTNRFVVCAVADSGGKACSKVEGGKYLQSGGSVSYTPAGSVAGGTHALAGSGADFNTLGADNSYATHGTATLTGTAATICPPYYALAYIQRLR